MIDLSSFFVFLSVVTVGLTILGCFAIYYGVRYKHGIKEYEVQSGRYEQEWIDEFKKAQELAKEMANNPPLDDDDDLTEDGKNDRKDFNKNKKNYH